MLTTGLVLSEDWVVTVATTLGPREGELKKNYEKKGTSQVNFRNTEINLFSCIKDDVLREFLFHRNKDPPFEFGQEADECHVMYMQQNNSKKDINHINTSEIPGELSPEHVICSYVKITSYLHK